MAVDSNTKEKKRCLLGDGKFPAEEAHGRCGFGWLLVRRGNRPTQHSGRLAGNLALLPEPLPKLLLRAKRRVLLLRPPLLLRTAGGEGIFQFWVAVFIAGLLGRSRLCAG